MWFPARTAALIGVLFAVPTSAGAIPTCPAPARVGLLVDNQTPDATLTITVDGDLAGNPPCAGGGATHYAATLTCTGQGLVWCGEIVGLAPGMWIHRLRVDVADSATQRQAQRTSVLAGARTLVANTVRWTAHPRTFVVPAATATALQETLAAAQDYTAANDGTALVTFDADAFPGAGDPRRLSLLQTPCTLDPRFHRCPADGAIAGLCLTGSRLVIDALDRDAMPGAVTLAVGTCGRQAVRVYGADVVLRGLAIEGSTRPRPTPPCQADTVVFTGADVQRSRLEQALVVGPSCGDGVSVERMADATVDASRITGAANKGFKVTGGATGTIQASCVHDNHNGGILATLGGHVRAVRNVVQHNVPGSAQHGIAAGGAGEPSTLVTDGNVVRFEGGRGLSVTNAAQADFRNDYVSDCQFAGARVETTADAATDVTPVARFAGVALVCNRTEGLTGTCTGGLDGADERPCGSVEDCCRTAAGDLDAACLDTARCAAGSFPLGFGAVIAAAADRLAPDVGFGDDAMPGRNAFTSNRNAPGGANLVATGTTAAVPAAGNQWEHCGTGATCDMDAVAANDVGASSGPVALGIGLAPRAEVPVVDAVVPGRPVAGDVVRILGRGFNAIEGNPAFQGAAPNCNELPACAPDGTCPTGPCVGGVCPCAIDSAAVQRRNQQTDANRLVIRAPDGTVLRTLHPDAVTPTMLAFRMPFDCYAPLVLEVSKRTPNGTRTTARHPLCDARGCVGQPPGTACDDGDACTTGDACDEAGRCVSGDPLTCDGDCLRCDTLAGCVPRPADTTCDDGDACTTGDRCDGVSADCIPGAPRTCAGPCLSGACDPAQGCTPRDAAAACDDGDACTVGDHCSGSDASCVAGVPRDCEAACLTGACDPASGCVPRPAGTVCREARGACDVAEQCRGDEPSCPADALAPADDACDDGDPCTSGDACAGDGTCGASGVVSCDDGDDCTTDVCVAFVGCAHETLQGLPALRCRAARCGRPALSRRLARTTSRLERAGLETPRGRRLTRRAVRLLVRCGVAP